MGRDVYVGLTMGVDNFFEEDGIFFILGVGQ